jgi:DNA polymerase (family 10)
LLEIRGDNPFRIRAYRNAARSVGKFGWEFKNVIEI